MLGEQIAELVGRVMGQRVLNAEGPTIETSISFNGKFKGIPVRVTVMFVGRPPSMGILHAEGHGIIMTGESEMATYRGVGSGRINPSGSVKWSGSHFYRTLSTGKFAFLNNVVGVFEAEVDAGGNAIEKIWEWK